MSFLIIMMFLGYESFSQSGTNQRIGRGAGECGTVMNPCPTILCTSGSINEPSFTISVPSGSRLTFSFDQGGGCGGSTGYNFDSGESVSMAWSSSTLTLFSGNGSTEATYSSCFYNNSAAPIDVTISVNTINTSRRDEAILLDYEVTSGNNGCSNLPIELLNFIGKFQSGNLHIYWSTATEKNNDYMAIERSVDGNNFSEIGRAAVWSASIIASLIVSLTRAPTITVCGRSITMVRLPSTKSLRSNLPAKVSIRLVLCLHQRAFRCSFGHPVQVAKSFW